jgi:Co/Zn/Cd efflux system component
MFAMALSKEHRVVVAMAMSTLFFLIELIVGFRNHSLVLVADAFHVASDLIGFAVALYAIRKRKSVKEAPKGFTFGWQRAELLGAFFNGGALSLSYYQWTRRALTAISVPPSSRNLDSLANDRAVFGAYPCT